MTPGYLWSHSIYMNYYSYTSIKISVTLVHEIFAWVLFSRSAPGRIYNLRELEWFAQLKVRENKIARFLKDIFWFFFLSTTKYQHLGCFSQAKPNFFCRCAKIRFARKWKKSWTKVFCRVILNPDISSNSLNNSIDSKSLR